MTRIATHNEVFNMFCVIKLSLFKTDKYTVETIYNGYVVEVESQHAKLKKLFQT